MQSPTGGPPRPGHLRVVLDAERRHSTAVILHAGRAHQPHEGLLRVRGFHAIGDGANHWLSAAQAAHGLWGYIDQDARWQVPPTLQEAHNPLPGETVARFREAGLWGFIDLKNGRKTEPLFADATDLRGGAQGVAGVQVARDAWRIVDSTGQFVSEALLHRIYPFAACGLARALQIDPQTHRALYGYVDRTGAWQIEAQYHTAHDFEDQEVAGATQNGTLWGLISRRGGWLLQPCHAHIGAFNDHHLAFFTKPNAWNEGVGYLDRRGQVAFENDRNLSDHMVCGVALHHAQGSRYFCHDGSALRAPALRYGSHFHAGGRFAVVLTSAEGQGVEQWGLLHASGRFVPAAPGLLEPVVQNRGELALPEDDTPLVPFLTDSGGVAWVDAEGAVQWTARYHACRVTLEDASGHTHWEGRRLGAECQAPRRYFQPPAEAFLRHITTPAQVVGCAESLLRAAQVLLHRFAAGEDPLMDADGHDGPEYSVVSAPGTVHSQHFVHAAHSTAVSRCVLRTHVDEVSHASFELLAQWRSEATRGMLRAMQAPLEGRFGPPTPDPEHAIAVHAEGAVAAWPVRMTRALPGDSGALQETSTLWLTLYRSFGADDGNIWNEICLVAAPSIDALHTALRTRSDAPPQPVVHGAPAQERRIAYADTLPALPRTRQEWLAAVQQDLYALAQVPPQWLDDAMADAAVAAHPQAFQDLPVRLQTQQRLERVVRSGPEQAMGIPARCMTNQGLVLARALHAGHPGWAARDEAASQVPDEWHRHALQGVWGAAVTPDMALAAVQSGVPLCDIPHWLRTEPLEAAALQADICNIAHIDASRITPELAGRAVRHEHARLIALLPRALLTPDLCLASVRAYGATLEDVPLALRTEAVCVAALQDRWDAFAHVPRPLRVAVTTRLIEHELAEQQGRSEPSASSTWLCQRAWAYLDQGDHENALRDAAQVMDRTSKPEHMHYVQAQALRALGRLHEAAVQASAVLSRATPYRPDWDYDEDTRWLARLVKRTQDAAAPMADDTLHARVARHPRMLGDVPRERITETLVQAALTADPDTVRYVPRRLMTSQRYALALRAGVKTLEQVPPALLSEDVYVEYVRSNGWLLSKVPAEWRTHAVCAQAVADAESALKHVPRDLRDGVLRAAREASSAGAAASRDKGREHGHDRRSGKQASSRRSAVSRFLERLGWPARGRPDASE